MIDSSPTKRISLTAMIAGYEQAVTGLLSRFAAGNAQFSTQFVIHKIIAASGKQIKNIRKNKSGNPDKLFVPVRWMAEQKIDERLHALSKSYDPENLNFIEATRLGIMLQEHLLTCYRSLELRTTGTATKKVLGQFINLKTSYLAKMKREYIRLHHQRS